MFKPDIAIGQNIVTKQDVMMKQNIQRAGSLREPTLSNN